jgi:hypothetical protein
MSCQRKVTSDQVPHLGATLVLFVEKKDGTREDVH